MSKFLKPIRKAISDLAKPKVGSLAITSTKDPTPTVPNSAGKQVYQISPLAYAYRFLILGSEGGSFGQVEQDLTKANIKNLEIVLRNDPESLLKLVRHVSTEGLSFRQNALLFTYAKLCAHKKDSVRAEALRHLNEICGISTNLFMFMGFVQENRGWGRALRGAVANWYLERTADELAYQMTKYRNREGFTHRDAIRLAHPDAENHPENVRAMLNFAVRGVFSTDRGSKKHTTKKTCVMPNTLKGYLEVKDETDPKKIVEAIREYGLVREHIDNKFFNDVAVWKAMLVRMPVAAMVRNLGKMTSIGLFNDKEALDIAVPRLVDPENIKRSKIHPMSILVASGVYSHGQGEKGSLFWTPNKRIVEALQVAFVHSFNNVTPSGKNILVGVDVSGSMTHRLQNTEVSSSHFAACMAMIVKRSEKNSGVVGFATKVKDLGINEKHTLDEIRKIMHAQTFGATDCSALMQFALDNKINVDTFVVITDNETNCNYIEPAKALRIYREKSGIKNAKLVVIATTATQFSIADPNDPYMLDIPGMSPDVPNIISAFSGID